MRINDGRPASITQNIACPSIMTRLKVGKTKHPIVYSLNIFYFSIFITSIKNHRFTINKECTIIIKTYKKLLGSIASVSVSQLGDHRFNSRPVIPKT